MDQVIGGSTREESITDNINEYVLLYLEQKYGEAFTYAGPAGNSMTGTHELYVYCDSFPNERIHVVVERFREPTLEIKDNYLLFKYHDEILELLTNSINAVFCDAKIYYLTGTSVPRSALPADATLNQVLDDGGVIVNALIEVRDSQFHSLEQAQCAVEEITARGCRYAFGFVSIEESSFGTLDSDELNDRVWHDQYEHYAVLAEGDGGIQASWYERGAEVG